MALNSFHKSQNSDDKSKLRSKIIRIQGIKVNQNDNIFCLGLKLYNCHDTGKYVFQILKMSLK